jgi:hypothetical protein
MAMSEGETAETIAYLREAEDFLDHGGPDGTGYKTSAMFPVLKHLINVCKRLAGDRAPLVE